MCIITTGVRAAGPALSAIVIGDLLLYDSFPRFLSSLPIVGTRLQRVSKFRETILRGVFMTTVVTFPVHKV